MYFKDEEYKNLMNDFLNLHHGQLVKLADNDGKIIAYLVRCECEKNNYKTLSFGIIFNIFYTKNTNRFPTNKELKFYAIKRAMTKGYKFKEKAIETNQLLNLKYILNNKKEMKNTILSDLSFIKTTYQNYYGIEFDEVITTNFVVKSLETIEKYYKNIDSSEINIVFI